MAHEIDKIELKSSKSGILEKVYILPKSPKKPYFGPYLA